MRRDTNYDSSPTSQWVGKWWISLCQFTKSGAVFALAFLTSILWHLFWVVMGPVRQDISMLVNWYIFMRFGLRQEYDVYEVFWMVGKWCPLVVISVYCLSWLFQVTLLHRFQQVVCVAVSLYNFLLFVYMLIAGGKIVSLFLVVLPLQLVLFLHHWWWVFLVLPTAIVLGYYACRCVAPSPLKPQQCTCVAKRNCRTPFNAIVIATGLVLAAQVLAALGINWVLQTGCLPCDTKVEVPGKPVFVAHRGCDVSFPENTIAAFRESAKIPGIVALESDIQISFDGVLFILHDPHLVRTTDAEIRCPTVDPLANATWLNFSTGHCPLQELSVGLWYTEDYSEEKLPTFSQYLEVAVETGLSVIFDIREPHVDHPYHGEYINRSLDVIASSAIDHRKVWWLLEEGREWVLKKFPAMIQVTKTQDTPFEEFEREHIQKVNDDWTTPLVTFRMYQEANISLNMYFVESAFIFNYAWCIGVDSVTTSNCVELSKLTTNTLYQVCRQFSRDQEKLLVPLTVTMSLCSFSCVTCFECIRKQTRKGNNMKS